MMELRLGHDFGAVRVHTDARAARSTLAVDAAAYTVGHHVVFGEGSYRPETPEGRRLLAHELAHVVQQAGTAFNEGDQLRVGSKDAPQEVEAQLASTGATARRGSDGPMLRRQDPSSRLRLRPPPLVARGMGSLIVDSFALGNAAIPAASTARVAELAATLVSLLEDYPGGSLEIVGHTDATGTEARNETLGQQRADGVRDALAAGGVPAGIILTRSAAAAAPVIPSRGQEPRNRRVQVIFSPESRLSLGMSQQLTPPTPPTAGAPARPVPGTPGGPPIPYDPLRPETPAEAGRRIFRPIPPAPEGERRSGADVINQAIDRALRPAIRGLPDWAQGAIRDGAHAAWQKGADALLDNALDQAGVTGAERDAIKKAYEAARKQRLP
jgi:outer membrane protein OmpA-like peptidoglycan-associated protein